MRVLDWLKASRAPFFMDVILCVCLGAVVARYETGAFDPWLLVACVVGVIFLNAGTNLANDYYDHRTGADEANPSPTPFSGGSRAIQNGMFSAKAIRNAAFLCFALAAGVGALLVWRAGWPVLAFGAVGAVSGVFYTAPPFKLGYRGGGEFLAGFNVGPVAVLGAYFVQIGTLSWGVVAVSLPMGLLSTALLMINEIPDAAPDREVGKMHLVARLGPGFGAWSYLALVVAAYASLGAAMALGLVPWAVAVAGLMVPVALFAFAKARVNLNSPDRIVPALGANVAALLGTGALLCVGYLVVPWLG